MGSFSVDILLVGSLSVFHTLDCERRKSHSLLDTPMLPGPAQDISVERSELTSAENNGVRAVVLGDLDGFDLRIGPCVYIAYLNRMPTTRIILARGKSDPE